jgi:peptidoglycan/xylan/chitin deacetylase (PgdA/CDA1 family)
MLNFKAVNTLTLVTLLILLSTHYFISLSLWPYLLLFIFWLTITTIGSFHIKWNYHIHSLNSNKNIEKNQVAITFDDGPHPEFTPKILALLKNHNAKATFFCIGKHIEQHPELVNHIIKQGHTIGNHTYSHANNFGFFKTKKVISELLQTNTIAKNKTGLTLNLYRPAFGVTNPRIKKALKNTGLKSIGWSNRSYDTTSISAEIIFNKINKRLSKGDVILLHDTSLKTVVVLEQLLLFLKQEDLESVTVDSLFNIKAYA